MVCHDLKVGHQHVSEVLGKTRHIASQLSPRLGVISSTPPWKHGCRGRLGCHVEIDGTSQKKNPDGDRCKLKLKFTSSQSFMTSHQ